MTIKRNESANKERTSSTKVRLISQTLSHALNASVKRISFLLMNYGSIYSNLVKTTK